MRRSRRFRQILWLALAIIAAAIVVLTAMRPLAPGYRFVATRVPIDAMNDATGRWFYYMPDVPQGSAPQLAAAVRAELLPQGFTEDRSNAPWFRFVKGSHEVVVCNHDEIATMPVGLLGVSVHHERVVYPPGMARQLFPVLWVHEPGHLDPVGIAWFKMKARILGY